MRSTPAWLGVAVVFGLVACGGGSRDEISSFGSGQDSTDPKGSSGDGSSAGDGSNGQDGGETGPSSDSTGTGGGQAETTADDGGGFPDGSGGDPWPDVGGSDEPMPVVYAHTNRDLYRIDPATLEVTHVGFIKFPEGINQMTDIALDRNERMLGISTRSIYEVNTQTAEATFIAELDRPYNGLSFIPIDDDTDILVGSTQDGWLYEIDPQTGASAPLGEFGDDMISSGDIVAVEGLTLATTTRDGWMTDRLVEVDPSSGVASNARDTRQSRVYGLGYWDGKVYGFSEDGSIVVIDAQTGEAEVVEQTEYTWWGAGVTTSAPIGPVG